MKLSPSVKKELEKVGITLTPLDIHNKDFGSGRLLGKKYDADEVDAYLDRIIKEYEIFYHLIQNMNSQIEDFNEMLAAKGEMSLEDLYIRVRKIEKYLVEVAQSKSNN